MRKPSRVTIALSLVAAIIVVAGGAAIASNAGFKLNKPLTPAGVGQIGSNWTSFPMYNPYGNVLVPVGPDTGKPSVQGVCDALGMQIGAGSITVLDEWTGSPQVGICGEVGTGAGGTANLVVLEPGKHLQLRDPVLTNAIIVGSHKPNLELTVPAAGEGRIGSLWHGVVYHSTWSDLQNVCDSIGLTPPNPDPPYNPRSSVQQLNAATGTFGTPWFCTGLPGSAALVLGEGIEVRNDKEISFTPSHF